jgi:HK97 family phage prohead protease
MRMSNITTASQIEYKSVKFNDVETKQEEINGVPIGIIRGMASTFGNVDLVDDVIAFGAFTNTIVAHKSRHDRPVRMMVGHDRFSGLIGGFPIDKIIEQKQGLKVEGHINLEVQRGRETFSLAKMGVLTDLSIGFIATDVELQQRGKREVRVIKEIDLREISIVDEPANPKATISEVKKAPQFKMTICDDILKNIDETNKCIEQLLMSDNLSKISDIKSQLMALNLIY